MKDRLVYRALTETNSKARFTGVTRPAGITEETNVSKSQRHPDMARLKSQPRIEPLGIDAGAMREQLDQLATLGARFRDGPLQHLPTDTVATAMRGDANIFY